MQSNTSRLLVALGAVVVVVAAFFVIKGDDDAGNGSSLESSSTTSTTSTSGDQAATTAQNGDEPAKEPADDVPVIKLVDGAPIDGITELEYDIGDEIHFQVTSDTDNEVHIHGYEIEKEVPAGKTVDFEFPAGTSFSIS